ncbi:MAG: nucleotide exchange factor GrpE [bacterium]|nr:nucleotide exchange factor GrpE [bacterium]
MSRKKSEISNDHDDINLVADEEFAVDEGKDSQLKKLREKLKECHAEKGEYLTGWQRAKADYVNQIGEHSRALMVAHIRAKASIIEDLIPTLDSFAMAMTGDAWQNVDDVWRIGIEHIYRQYEEALKNNGLQIIDPYGQPFDPQFHQAVEEKESTEVKDGCVLKVLQKGFMLGEQLIRPARVVVAKNN